MKSFENIKEKEIETQKAVYETINENEAKITFPLKNGLSRELYLSKNGKISKVCIKDINGNILEFADLKASEKNSIYIDLIKKKLLKEDIALTDDQIKKVINTILSSDFYENLDEFDAETEH